MPARSRLAFLWVATVALAGCGSEQTSPRTAFDLARCPEDAAPPSGEVVITRFYEALARHDFPGMACNYAPDVEFSDPIFGALKGKRAFAMWAMIVERGEDLRLQYSEIRAAGAEGHAHWDAQYTFSFLVFGNAVENTADATFELKDGKIIRHHDQYDMRRWMRMGLWPFGGIVGESTLRDGVQSKLDDFIEKHPEYQEPKSP
jgi:hypothetical protein